MKAMYGYCGMTADFLHIGHIKFIQQCKKKCDKLIVGVMTDECVYKYKGHYPIMNTAQRVELVSSIKDVYKVYIQKTFAFPHHILSTRYIHGKDFIIFDTIEHNRKGADVIIKRTANISSTLFRKIVSENSNNSSLTV